MFTRQTTYVDEGVARDELEADLDAPEQAADNLEDEGDGLVALGLLGDLVLDVLEHDAHELDDGDQQAAKDDGAERLAHRAAQRRAQHATLLLLAAVAVRVVASHSQVAARARARARSSSVILHRRRRRDGALVEVVAATKPSQQQ